MKTIYLHGTLGERFGGKYDLNIHTPKEAINALGVQLKGFLDEIHSGEWLIYRDDDLVVNEEDVHTTLNGVKELHFIPAIEGEKGRGGKSVGKAVVGTALIAGAVLTAGQSAVAGASFFAQGGAGANIAFAGITHSQIALFGGAMVLGGISQLLTPVPNRGDYDESDTSQERNGMLGGGGNTSEQGAPVPLCYGLMRTGSHIIQVGMSTEKLLPVEYIYSKNTKRIEMTTGSRTWDSVNYIGGAPDAYSRGMGFSFEDDEDGYIQNYGTLSSYTIKNEDIAFIAQVEDGGSYYLDFGLREDRHISQDFIDRIRIETTGGSEVINKVTLSADLYEDEYVVEPTPEQARLIYRDPEADPSEALNEYSNEDKFYRWRWNLSGAVLSDATDYIVYLEYN